MKLGHLIDRIREYEEAERNIEEAKLSYYHGGSPETIQRKKERLDDREQYLQDLREEDV